MSVKSISQKVTFGATMIAASLLANGATAQENLLGELYGLGVHSYYSNDYNDAVANLSAAIEGGTRDPRVFYFRGFAYASLGQTADAQADFDKGAQMEVAGGGDQYPIGKSLERVQGAPRLTLERVRKIARIRYQREELAKDKQRYENQSVVQEPVLGQADPTATSKAVEELVDPTAPVEGGDPFGAEGGLGTGATEAAPTTPEIGGPPAGGDPFGAGSDPGAGEPAPPMPAGGDPFGAGDLEPATPPAGGDPFGGAEPEPAPPAGGDPFGGVEEPAPPAGGDPFGGAEPAVDPEPAPPAGGDPFGGAEEPAPPAGGDPFGGAEPAVDPEPAPPAGGDPFGGAEEPAPPAGGDPFGGAEPAPAGGDGVVDAVIGGVGDALEGAGEPDDRDPFDDTDEPKPEAPADEPAAPGADDLFGGDDEPAAPVEPAPVGPAVEPAAPAADPFGGAEPAPAGDDPFGAPADAPAGEDPFGAAAPADAVAPDVEPEMEEKTDPFADDVPADNPVSDDPFADAP